MDLADRMARGRAERAAAASANAYPSEAAARGEAFRTAAAGMPEALEATAGCGAAFRRFSPRPAEPRNPAPASTWNGWRLTWPRAA